MSREHGPITKCAVLLALLLCGCPVAEAHPAERRCNDRAVISLDVPAGGPISVRRRFVCVYGRWVEFFDIPNPGCCIDQEPTP